MFRSGIKPTVVSTKREKTENGIIYIAKLKENLDAEWRWERWGWADGYKTPRYLSTHHERDQATGYDNRGARLYDSEIGRFLGVDPLAGKFPSWSPYNYAVGNPLIFVDPSGETIQIAVSGYQTDENGEHILDENGNKIEATGYITYTPGMALTGNEFADNVIQALEFIIANNADPSQIINSLAYRKSDNLIIREGKGVKDIAFSATFPRFSFMNAHNEISKNIEGGKPTVTWNPTTSLAFSKKRSTSNPFAAVSYRTPAENLLHELGHAYNFFEDPMALAKRFRRPDADFDNLEERYNITNIENVAANILYPDRKLNDRMHHGGWPITVATPTTIK